MSLRNDIKFVAMTLGGAIRQILGEAFRQLADYLLGKEEPHPSEVQEATPVKVETPSVRTRRSVNTSRKQVISRHPPPDVVQPDKPIKVRDRSGYLAKEHGSYKIAAIAILKVFLNQEAGKRLSVPELYKLLNNTSTDSTIRTACKTMVEDQIFDTVHEDGARSAVYWVKDIDAASNHLANLEAVAPKLPVSNEGGEPETSLN